MKASEIRRTGGNGRRCTCASYNGLLYISGITSTDIEGDTAEQTRNVLEQIDKLLAFNNTDKNQVLNATIFLKNIEEYGAFNSVWDEWVIDGFEPTRSVIEAQLSLSEYQVKIALIAAF